MTIAWRLTHQRYQDQAISGNGGLFAPGRWHSQGRRIIYSSSSLSLATLELLVNLQIKHQLAHYVKTRIRIPDELIADLEAVVLKAFLAGRLDSRACGDRWLAEKRSCALRVPSRVVPQEANYLLNPLHPAFTEIAAETDTYQADERLWR